MTVSSGALARASEYNSVATLVNKVFGDNYSSSLPTDVDRTNHKFGWGAVNIDASVPVSELITADRLQYMVDRVNIMIDHCNITDTFLYFAAPTASRVTVDKFTLIRAEDLNVVENKIINTILSSNIHLSIDPTDASLFESEPTVPMLRSTPWNNILTGEFKWVFDSYNHARYFFNSGGQVRLSFDLSGGSTAGYYNWADVLNEIGILSMTYDNILQSSNNYSPGIREEKGFYDLTEYYGDGSDAGSPDEGLLFTSAGVSPGGYGYGSSGYSSYSSLRAKVYGKWANGGSEVHFKIILDDTAFDQVVDGTLLVIHNYLMPDIITRSSWAGTAEFDVTPDPYVVVIDNFNSGDDS